MLIRKLSELWTFMSPTYGGICLFNISPSHNITMSFDVLSLSGGVIRWGLYNKRENKGQSTEQSVVDNVCPEMNELGG